MRVIQQILWFWFIIYVICVGAVGLFSGQVVSVSALLIGFLIVFSVDKMLGNDLRE